MATDSRGTAPQRVASQRVRWHELQTVLLDMDGTLLDLQFDNYFWLELVPQRFAQHRGMALADARTALMPRFAARQGTLEWYCTDYWSRELQFNVADLKHEVRERVRFLPGAVRFLTYLRELDLQRVLVTNAHRDALRIKSQQTGLLQHIELAISSHDYGAPKEDPQFWRALSRQLDFDPARTLFVDDSLAVLRAARNFGIAQVIAIAHPDSAQAPRAITEFPSVPGVVDLIDPQLASPHFSQDRE